MSEQGKLELLLDVRSRLDELVKSQEEFRKTKAEAMSLGNTFRMGLGIDFARRGVDLLTRSLHDSVFEAFRLADAIQDNARNLEVSQRAYQVLASAFRSAGGDASMLNTAIAANNRSLADARDQSTTAAAAYRTLGLSARNLEGVPVERRMEAIGRAMLNARDRTEAFDAAGKILGTRNLPTLLGALRELATDGYDRVAEAAENAGKIMSDQTIALLADAKKQVEEFKAVTLPVAAGSLIGWLQSGMDKLGEGVANLINRMEGLDSSTFSRPSAAPRAPSAPSEDKTPLRQTAEWRRAELDLRRAINQQAITESDNTTDALAKRADLIVLLWDEYHARKALLQLAEDAPVTGDFTQHDKDLLIEKLRTELALLGRRKGNVLDNRSAFQRRLDDAAWFNTENPQANRNFLRPGEGVAAGAGDWVTSLGSRGEQVAGALQSSLGATVQGISDGIHGWLTGTQSFGDAMLQLGDTVFRTIIDTIVQMGVQWLVTQALIKTGMIATHATGETLRAGRMAGAAAEGAGITAAMAPAAATSSIASFGAAAVLGIVALLAAMAMFGGFAQGGYTGDLPTNAIAGVVHGQEGVLNAPAMRQLGIERLNQLNSGVPLERLALPPAATVGPVAASAPSVLGANSSAGPGGAQPIAILDGRDDDLIERLERDPRGEAYVVRIMQQNRQLFGVRL